MVPIVPLKNWLVYYSAQQGGLHGLIYTHTRILERPKESDVLALPVAAQNKTSCPFKPYRRMSSYNHIIWRLCLWPTVLPTWGFSLDWPFTLCARVPSNWATHVQHVDPPSYNINIILRVWNFADLWDLLTYIEISYCTHCSFCVNNNKQPQAIYFNGGIFVPKSL